MDKLLSEARFWQFDHKSVFPFGKHKGKTLLQVFEEEPNYIVFCLRDVKKFVLTVLGWNTIHESNPTFLDANAQVFTILLNKQLEVNRILRENTYLNDIGDHPHSYFSRRIAFINAAQYVIKTKFKRAEKTILTEEGDKINVRQVYHQLSYSDKELSSEKINEIEFSVKIIDFKDLSLFKKYSPEYGKAGVKVFEIARSLPCGLVALVISLNYLNFRIEALPFGGDEIIRVLPDDSECILHIINSTLTTDGIVGERDMTQAEIDAAVSTANERLNKAKENGPKKEDEDFWWDYEYDDLTPEDYEGKKVKVYGPINELEIILQTYSINRKAFPNTNLFRTSSLQYHAHTLQFYLHTDEIDTLMKQWYEANNNLKEYESRVEKAWENRRAYWRSQNESLEEPDYDRESWEESTDGQEGAWEDWHDPID